MEPGVFAPEFYCEKEAVDQQCPEQCTSCACAVATANLQLSPDPWLTDEETPG